MEKYEIPEGGFRHGDIVMSKHHGRGLWCIETCEATEPPHQRSHGAHIHPVIRPTWVYHYTNDGRYHTDGAFEDKECVVALIERMIRTTKRLE